MIFKWLYVLMSTAILFSSAHQESINGTHLSVQKERRDGYFALVIRGTGMYTFVHEFGSTEENYQINSLQVIHEDFVIEGYYLEQATRTYHAYFLVISPEGEILYHQDFNDPASQDIAGVYPLHQGYLVHLTEADEKTGWFVQDYLVKVDDEDITSTSFDREIMTIEPTSEGYHVTFKYDDTATLFVTLAGDFLVGRDLMGVENKATYDEPVTLLFPGEATLNKMPIKAPHTVYAPGHYTLIHHQVYTRFTVHPEVSGVKADTVYTQPVQITYELGQALLNDEPYASNQWIEKPGRYLFGMYIDDYIFEIPFTLTANVQGIKHLETYDVPVQITFLGEGYLNNQLIRSGHEVTEPGRHTLKVFGVNQYLETHTFEIVDPDATTFQIEWIETALLGGSILLGAGLTIDVIIRRFKKKRP